MTSFQIKMLQTLSVETQLRNSFYSEDGQYHLWVMLISKMTMKNHCIAKMAHFESLYLKHIIAKKEILHLYFMDFNKYCVFFDVL